MSLTFTATIRCDGATCSTHLIVPANTIATARRLARADGWLFRRGDKSYCPTCRYTYHRHANRKTS